MFQVESYKCAERQVSWYSMHLSSLTSNNYPYSELVPEDFIARSKGRKLALNPIAFEAHLHIPDSNYEFSRTKDINATSDYVDSCQDRRLEHQILRARCEGVPAKTYALFADMVISAVSGGGGQDSADPLISVELAVNLLRRIISAVRAASRYDIVQASRWIRCIVQLVIDGRNMSGRSIGGSTEVVNSVQTTLQIVQEVVDQAIVLAVDAKRQPKQDGQQRQPIEPDSDVEMQDTDANAAILSSYPAEELEWLATTLFNLAVDLFIYENEDGAKQWSRKAVEVADVLAANVDGDRGMLARVLRGKVVELGWSV